MTYHDMMDVIYMKRCRVDNVTVLNRAYRQERLHEMIKIFCYVILCCYLARPICSLGKPSSTVKEEVRGKQG